MTLSPLKTLTAAETPGFIRLSEFCAAGVSGKSLGYIEVDGGAWLSGAWNTANRLGKPEAGEQYLQDVAQIVGGSVRRYEKNWPDVVYANGRAVDASTLLATGGRWKEAMTRLIAELRTTAS